MTTYNVNSQATLNSAISSAGSGDEIVLAAGVNYGNITINNKSLSTENPLVIRNTASRSYGTTPTAAFGTLTIGPNATNGITIRGIAAGTIDIYGDNCIVEYCYITGVMHSGGEYPYYPRSDHTIRYNEFYQSGLFVSNVINCNVHENFFHKKHGDMMNMIGESTGTIYNNVFFDLQSDYVVTDPHWDFIQFFRGATTNKSPDNVTIRGNIAIDDPSTDIEISGGAAGGEGFFIGGPTGNGYTNLVIEQNMVWCLATEGIVVISPLSGTSISNNTVFGSGAIRVETYTGNTYSTPITDNITNGVIAAGPGGSSQSGNLTGTMSDYLEDPTNDLDWTMFIPKEAYSTKGAATRIAEIQAGTNVEAVAMAAAIYPSFTEPGTATPEAPSIPGTPTKSGTEAVNQILTFTPSTPVTGYPTPTRTWKIYNTVDGLVQDSASNQYQLQASDEGDQIYGVQHEENASGTDTAQTTNTGTIAAAPTAPVPTNYSPADNATGVAQDATLTITFDTTMQLGPSGRINLWRPDDGIVDYWDVVAHAGTGEHSIHADGNDIIMTGWVIWPMHLGVTYSILIDNGALESTGGVAFPGIADTTTWNFTVESESSIPNFGGRIQTTITVA